MRFFPKDPHLHIIFAGMLTYAFVTESGRIVLGPIVYVTSSAWNIITNISMFVFGCSVCLSAIVYAKYLDFKYK